MMWRVGMTAVVLAGLVAIVVLGTAVVSSAAEATKDAATQPEGAATSPMKNMGLALGAGLVGGLSILGAGIAVGRAGSAAIGAVSEKPEFFVRALIFVALAEGLAVLGFALAYMMMPAK
jgi:V/A-type H+/Na+-transporting ATPase subunit K